MQVWYSSVIRSSTCFLGGLSLTALCLSILGAPVLAQTFSTPDSPFGESRFLPVEEAFPYQLSIDARDRLTVQWQIAPGYYLYQDKFRFVAQLEAGERVLETALNEATAHHDEFFGDVMVYYGTATVSVSLPADLPKQFTLRIEYQGCADAGLCYPLQRDELPILL